LLFILTYVLCLQDTEHIIGMTRKYDMVVNEFLMVISSDFDFLALFTFAQGQRNATNSG